MSKFEALIASPPDRESVVFEIWCGNRQFAEISKEPGRDYEIEVYAAADGGVWHLDLMEFKTMLEGGIRELASNP
ncbi:hypothetical protein LGM35_22640 [Burkholderia cenocepacia]|uniref:hypothetical protein n=1 Tax=Burkholderia cenocepacia TaxID=95486 RepID=UPI001CF4D2BE|nr:hypothetical protein [Burkholderia cenocepacia]MCA7925300.1 hypothetical protein [Burkholderia cenocepacia]